MRGAQRSQQCGDAYGVVRPSDYCLEIVIGQFVKADFRGFGEMFEQGVCFVQKHMNTNSYPPSGLGRLERCVRVSVSLTFSHQQACDVARATAPRAMSMTSINDAIEGDQGRTAQRGARTATGPTGPTGHGGVF